jgi:hypothetical protein
MVEVFAQAQKAIDSTKSQGNKSDGILSSVEPGLTRLGYEVETGRKATEKIDRPVLYGEEGVPRVRYQVDAWHQKNGVILEVEAGRGVMGNAFYRDLVRGSLIVGAKYMAIAVMTNYEYKSGGKTTTSRDYDFVRDQLDAIYASGRLDLPFDGLLLIGY